MPETTQKEKIARIDERTLNIWRAIEKIQEHMEDQNGTVNDNKTRSKINRYLIGVILAGGGVTTAANWDLVIALVK